MPSNSMSWPQHGQRSQTIARYFMALLFANGISTQATFAVEISATAATTSTSVDRGLITCTSSFADNEKGPEPVSLGLVSVLLCCRLLSQLPSRFNQTSFSRDTRNVPHTQEGLLNRAKLGNSVSRQPGDSRHLPAPPRRPLKLKGATLNAKRPLLSGRPGDLATQRLRDLATRRPCDEIDPLSGASSFNSQLARTTDPVFAPSAE